MFLNMMEKGSSTKVGQACAEIPLVPIFDCAVSIVQIANIGPADWNYDETMSTLRYANRAKNIKNKPVINEDPKDALLRDMQKEMEQLRARLAGDGAVQVRT